MNYNICLDPNSVNFNINSLSGNGFAIYTDADNFTNPIAVNIPSSLLFPSSTGNCQFSLSNIPGGANQILVVDQCDGLPPSNLEFSDVPSYNCCYALLDIPENCLGWCNECNIEFDTIDFNTVGRIIAGNLESSCGPVTDYVIGWYRNGDYSSPEVTTGFGTAFNYQYSHPLNTTTAPLVLDGFYEGIIHDIKINGIQYSNPQSGSGDGIPIPFESCFGTIVVAPFTCENGNFPPPYSHQINLTAAGNGIFPGPASTTFLLSSSTNYFAYDFDTYTVHDDLKIKFISGDPNNTSDPDLYSQPIYLDYISIGLTTTPSNNNNLITYGGFNSNIYPKESVTNTFRKILTLTTLERTNGDKLEITISPNPNFPETSWKFRMQCLETIDCNWCIVGDSKLVDDITINRTINLNSCQKKQSIKFSLSSSCNWFDDLVTYGGKYNNSPFSLTTIPSIYNFISPSPGYNPVNTGFYPNSNPYNNCFLESPLNYTDITYSKTNTGTPDPNGNPTGVIKIEFSNNPYALNLYNEFRNEIESVKNTYFPIQYQYQPDSYQYYRGWIIRMPNNNGNIPCGDNQLSYKTYYVHRDSDITYTEIPSLNYYSIEMTMPYVDPVPQFQTLYTGGFYSCCGNPYNIDLSGNFNSISYAFNNSSTSISNLLDWTSNYSYRMYPSSIADPYGCFIISPITPPSPSTLCYTTSSYCCLNNTYVSQPQIRMEEITTIPFIESLSNPTQFINLTNLKTTPCSIPDEVINNWNTSSFNNLMTFEWDEVNYSIQFQNLPNDINSFKMYSSVVMPNTEGEVIAPFEILEYTGSIAGGPGGIVSIDTNYFTPGFNASDIKFLNWTSTGPAPF